MQPAVSVLILARDERDRIGDAIASSLWADEVVVADTGSVDGTQDLARARGARVVEFPWEGYAASRNRALETVRNDWVFFIDADERIGEDLAEEVRTVLSRKGATLAGMEMPRLSHLCHTPIRHGTWYPDVKLRVGRRSLGFRAEGGRVHERLTVEGPVVRLRSDLRHYPYRDLSDAIRKAERYARLGAEDRFEKGRRAGSSSLLVRPPLEFLRSYVVKAGFLDGRPGLHVAFLHAASYFLRAAFLLERWSRAGREDAGFPAKERST